MAPLVPINCAKCLCVTFLIKCPRRTMRAISYISSPAFLKMNEPDLAIRSQSVLALLLIESRDHKKYWLEVWAVMRDAGMALQGRRSCGTELWRWYWIFRVYLRLVSEVGIELQNSS